MKVGDLIKNTANGWIGIVLETDIGGFRDIRVMVLHTNSLTQKAFETTTATWSWEVLNEEL
jgi:hypothetical protein